MKLGFTPHGVPITLTDDERRRHLYLIGKTGTGKTSLLQSMILDDLSAGRGFALIDPHGDLAKLVADSIPRHRTKDAIYLDPLDPTHSVGFNPVERVQIEKRSQVASAIVSAFKSIWSESWGPRLEYILGNTVRLLLDVPHANLLQIPRVLVDDRYRSSLLRHITDPFIRYFWMTEFPSYSDRFRNEAIAPVQNKAGQFAANPLLRHILGQSSTLRADALLSNDGILIANLSKQMGDEPSHLLGALLTTAFYQAAERRAAVPEDRRRDFTLYVDEFQNFATDTFATILSEARKWRLNLVIANQFLGQLSDNLRLSVLGNVGTLVVFRVGSDDAVRLANELGIETPQLLTDIPNYEAWIKQVRNNVPTEPTPIKTALVEPQRGRLAAVVAHTRARRSRPRDTIEQSVSRLW